MGAPSNAPPPKGRAASTAVVAAAGAWRRGSGAGGADADAGDADEDARRQQPAAAPPPPPPRPPAQSAGPAATARRPAPRADAKGPSASDSARGAAGSATATAATSSASKAARRPHPKAQPQRRDGGKKSIFVFSARGAAMRVSLARSFPFLLCRGHSGRRLPGAPAAPKGERPASRFLLTGSGGGGRERRRRRATSGRDEGESSLQLRRARRVWARSTPGAWMLCRARLPSSRSGDCRGPGAPGGGCVSSRPVFFSVSSVSPVNVFRGNVKETGMEGEGADVSCGRTSQSGIVVDHAGRNQLTTGRRGARKRTRKTARRRGLAAAAAAARQRADRKTGRGRRRADRRHSAEEKAWTLFVLAVPMEPKGTGRMSKGHHHYRRATAARTEATTIHKRSGDCRRRRRE